MKVLKLKKDTILQLSKDESNDIKGGTFGTNYVPCNSFNCPSDTFCSRDVSCNSCGNSCVLTCKATDPQTGESCLDPSCLPPCKDITQTQPTPTEGIECGKTLYYTCNNCQL